MIAVANDEELKQNIKANVASRLRLLGWSQKELARRTGENQPTINRVCRGENLPGTGVLHRIAEALGSSLDQLTSPPPQENSRVAS